MKHTIEIDDQIEEGKGLLSIVKVMEKKSKGVRIVNDTYEEKVFLTKMLKARQGGILNKKEKEDFVNRLKRMANI